MAKLGFLGLGLMGDPMARNLIKAGHDVALWSNTRRKGQSNWRRRRAAKSAPRLPRSRNTPNASFICVGNSAMSETVILGPDGVKEGAKKG